MPSVERSYPHTGHLRSLADLGLSDDQLAELAVVEAKGAIRALAAVGLEPTEATQRCAAGDPELVAAYVAKHSTSRSTDVA
jgi:hypothetical protein